MSKVDLRVDWCSYEAAKFAVEHWHYSRSMPTPPVIRIGVWEDQGFVGSVLFSRGANNNLGRPYGLSTTEVCELTRVALSRHASPVSKILAVAIRFLQNNSPGVRLIVSFADPNQGHIGTIYQAGNWLYSGFANSTPKYRTKDGRVLHNRQVSKTGVKPQYGEMRAVPKIEDCEVIPQLDKHRYLYPLDDAMRKQIEPLRQPYPKYVHAAEAIEDAAGDQPEKGGASPTLPLHLTKLTNE